MKTSVGQQLLCFHCGDIVLSEIKQGDKSFCCEGCLTVHNILSESGMGHYYEMGRGSGNKVLHKDAEEFAFLDNPEIAGLLIDFKNEDLVRLNLQLPAIHCSSCIWLLEHLNLLHPGILFGRVDFLKKELTVRVDPNKISVRQLVELLRDIGYKPDISLKQEQKEKQDKSERDLLLKLAVAGFCFGNIMLFSFPEYFGLKLREDEVFARFFSYINLVLALPVLFYSAYDYFDSAIKSLRKKVLHINVPLALGMLALFLRSAYEIIWQVGPGYLDSFAGLLFFLLSGKWFQQYTWSHLNFERDYKSYFPLAVTVKEGERWVSRLLSEIQKGDRLRIRNGELIPADSIVLKGDALIDYSFVTGESIPVSKVLGEIVYGGGRQSGAAIEIEIVKEVAQSQLTRIWNGQESTQKESSLESFSSKVSRYFTIALLAIACSTFLIWSFSSWSIAFFSFTSVLIVACPCALALSSPLALGNTLRLLGRKGLYLKNAAVVEQMAQINHIVFDKTGTLTEPELLKVKWLGGPLSESESAAIKELTSHSNHPYSRAVYQSLQAENGQLLTQVKEIPGSGLSGMHTEFGQVKIGNAAFNGISGKMNGPAVYVTFNGIERGKFLFENAYRSKVANLLNELGKTFKISILSGDHASEELHLKEMFSGFDQLKFSQTPEQKQKFIQELEASGDRVMMVGDGLNDAGALRMSNTGIAISGQGGQFTPAASGILMAAELENFPSMMKLAKRTLGAIHFSFAISILYNIVGLWFAVQGQLSPVLAAVLMPLSSISVVLINTFITNYYAYKLKLK